MHLDPELIEELNLLMRLHLNTSSEGISISGTADPAVVAAAKRLFQKGLVSQEDGGRLTDAGSEAADLMNQLTNLMSPPLEPI
ncbi:MAG: TIGR02647 family protein [Proteobacteria bacterium]|nr:TIGR02647 family protein [Pseudomonadota bacterium]